MNLIEYQKFTLELMNPSIVNDAKTIQTYLWSKLINEMLELSQELDEKVINVENIIDESGDVLWYISNICNHYDLDLTHIVDYWRRLPPCREYRFEHCLFAANDLSGMIYKNLYHEKVFDREMLISSIYLMSYHFLMFLTVREISLQEVVDFNHKKLKERHGKVYNKSFYNKV